MIWEYNDWQTHAGSKVGTASFDGSRWVVWEGGKVGKDGGDIVTFVSAPRESGTVDLLDFFRYLAGKRWLSGGMNAKLWQIDWGAELCGAPINTVFAFTAFNVKFSMTR